MANGACCFICEEAVVFCFTISIQDLSSRFVLYLASRESSAADQHAEAFAASAGLVLLLFYAKLLICNSGFHRAYKKIL